MAYEIQLKLMVGNAKHLTPYQFNIGTRTCTYRQTRTWTKRGGSSFSARLRAHDPDSALRKEMAPTYTNLNNI